MAHNQFNSRSARAGAGSARRRSSGFTLLELMIVVVIIAVLAGIAYANYSRSVVESRRKAATACLLEGAQFMERFYTTRLTYANPPAPLPLGCINELAASYTVAINGTPNGTTYQLQAVPVAGSQQANKDTLCATLGINQAGTKTESGTGVAANCW